MAARTILVTGFPSFGGEPRNPSGEIASALSGVTINGARVESVVLPVVRERAWPELRAALDDFLPDVVLALGLAPDRPAVSVERMAVNLDDYESPDEKGVRPRNEPIVPAGPDSLFATADVEVMLEAIRKAGVPAALSDSAGTFLCNHVFYRLLHQDSAGTRRPVGFLHLPSLPESVAIRREGRPSMALETSRRAVEAALGALAGSPRASSALGVPTA